MSSASFVRTACRLLAAVAAVSVLNVSAVAKEKEPAAMSDESAIRTAVESYVAAYNRGDAKAVATHWSESGQWISPTGQRFAGRSAIERETRALFTANKGVHIEMAQQPSIRFLSPEVAIEEGTVRVLRPGESPSDSTYLAVHVKKDGQWKLDTVRETEVPEAPTASTPLQDLAWLVGDWIDASPQADVQATVTWTKNKTFLNYAFKVSAPGMDDLEGTQVIGWDPAAGTIRSWMFDSDGGFGEGTWSKRDNSWVIKFNQVLPDGRKASATNIYNFVDANTLTWRSIGRKLDGEFLPNIDEVKMVRKTAGDAAKPTRKVSEKPKQRGTKN